MYNICVLIFGISYSSIYKYKWRFFLYFRKRNIHYPMAFTRNFLNLFNAFSINKKWGIPQQKPWDSIFLFETSFKLQASTNSLHRRITLIIFLFGRNGDFFYQKQFKLLVKPLTLGISYGALCVVPVLFVFSRLPWLSCCCLVLSFLLLPVLQVRYLVFEIGFVSKIN